MTQKNMQAEFAVNKANKQAGLRDFFHHRIPPELRETLRPDTAEYVRVRALAGLLWVITVISGVAMVIMIAVHCYTVGKPLLTDFLWAGIFVLFLAQHVILQKAGNVAVSGVFFTAFYLFLVAALLVANGGFDAYGKTILLTCPVLAFLVGGQQEGIMNFFSITFLVCGLIALKYIHFDLPNFFHAENQHLFFCMNWTATALVIYFSFALYELSFERRDRS